MSQEQLSQRLIEVLEEEKIDSDRSGHRSNSPGDAFQDAFTQYGMRLGPELMRLSMESAHEDSENEAENCNKSSEGQLTDNEEEEENDFLAEQRFTSKKSNPGSGQVSLQSSGTGSIPMPPNFSKVIVEVGDDTVTDKTSSRSVCSESVQSKTSTAEDNYSDFPPG